MKRFFILIFLSLIGLSIAIVVIFYGDKSKTSDTVALPTIKLPFNSFIAGTGVIEAGSKNITLGSSVTGVVKKVYVQSGDKIKKGELLFEIDDSLVKAKLLSAKHRFDLIESLKKIFPNLVTKEKYLKIKDDFYQLQEKAKLYKIYSPIDGKVLSCDISKGSFFDKNSKALVIGSKELNVKVSINEFDISKFKAGLKAVAYIRGDNTKKIDLDYLYTIPYVKPKTTLTGSPTERTDTRVLQIVYHIKDTNQLPLYVGEELNVFIKIAKE